MSRGNYAEARKAQQLIEQDIDRWTKELLPEAHRSRYRELGPRVITKSSRDASYRARKKINRDAKKVLGSIDQWIAQAEKGSKNEQDHGKVLKFIRESKSKLRSPSISAAEAQKQKALLTQLEKARDDIQSKIAEGGWRSSEPEVTYIRRKASPSGRFKKGSVAARRSAREYVGMLGESGFNSVSNKGYIRGAADSGVKWLLVSDGPDCGWVSHRDPGKANGKIVSPEEASANPLAHPNCQRQFSKAAGPPGSKRAREQIRRLLGVASSREAKKALLTAALLGQAAGATAAAVQSPLVQKMIRAILSDTQTTLSPFTEKLLTKWSTGYLRVEASAMRMAPAKAGSATDLRSSASSFRAHVSETVDNVFSNESVRDGSLLTKVRLPPEVARALRIPQTVSKGTLLERMDDYADWVEFDRFRRASLADRLFEQTLDLNVRGSIYGEAAIRFDLGAVRGATVFTKFNRSIQVLNNAAKADPERVSIEAVRLLATVVEPLPWVTLKQGPMRFSVGMTADGRRDLAEAIFRRVRDSRGYSRYEIDFMRRLGVEIKNQSITIQQVVNSFRPRLTYLGQPLSATIAMESGRIVPVVKIYPSGAISRQLSMNVRLRTEQFQYLISDLREAGRNTAAVQSALKNFLRNADQLSVVTLDAFRNGPIRASLRLHGSRVESFAIKLRPQPDWVRYNYRFYNWKRRVPYTGPDGRPLLDASGRKIWVLRDEMGRVVKDSAGKTISVQEGAQKVWQSVTILPRAAGGVMFTSTDGDIAAVMFGLVKLKGGIMNAARAIRADYGSFSAFISEQLRISGVSLKELYEDIRSFQKAIHGGAMLQVRSLADLREIGERYRYRPFPSKIGSFQGTELRMGAIEASSEFIDPRLLDPRFSHPSLGRDLATVANWWKGVSARTSPLRFRFIDDELAPHALWYSHADRVIYISESAARNWASMGRIRAKMISTGFFPRGTRNSAGSLLHEVGHQALDGLSRIGTVNLFDNMAGQFKTWAAKPPSAEYLRSLSSKKEIVAEINGWIAKPGVRNQIHIRLGVYASSGFGEFVAEAFVEGAASQSPRKIAAITYEILSRSLRQDLRFV